MSKNTPTANTPAVPDYVPETQDSEEYELPYVAMAALTDRNLILWNVLSAGDRPGYNNGPARETWVIEVSADDAPAATNVAFFNHAALLNGLKRIPAFPARVRIEQQTGKAGQRYYCFVAPTK